MEIVRRIGVVFGWIFVAAIVVGAFYIMYLIGSTYFKTEENFIRLTAESEQRAEDLNSIFSDFAYQTKAKAIVNDEQLREGEEGEDAYAEMVINEQGQLNDIYTKYSEQLSDEGYSPYSGDSGVYYNSSYEDENRQIVVKFIGADEDVIVLELAMEQNGTCNIQNRCRYLPESNTEDSKPLNGLDGVPIKEVKAIKASSSSPLASLDR